MLLALEEAGEAHGYQLAGRARQLGLADPGLDGAAVYRTLRDLEAQGCVASTWDTGGAGPARRVYQLTPLGRERLSAWAEFLRARTAAMENFVRRFDELLADSAEGEP